MTKVSILANIIIVNYTVEYFHRRVKGRDTSRFCEKNSGNSGTGIANCPEKDEGGAEWLM